MTDFVRPGSIVRKIWGDADLVLFVFAGSAAEFALNKAVDWLFFTGKLPADPIGRLFSTAGYGQQIAFADEDAVQGTFDRINAAHDGVEKARGRKIPDWAYRDVLYMLIDYSERAYELLNRRLTSDERDDLYDVFYRVGTGLRVRELPKSYTEWKSDRERHMLQDLAVTEGTDALYKEYRRSLGVWRFNLMLRMQALLVPEHVRYLLHMSRSQWLRPFVRTYPVLARAGLRSTIQKLLIPREHLAGIRDLDRFQHRF